MEVADIFMHLLIRLIAAMELLDKIEAVINLFFVVIQSAPYKNELFLGKQILNYPSTIAQVITDIQKHSM